MEQIKNKLGIRTITIYDVDQFPQFFTRQDVKKIYNSVNSSWPDAQVLNVSASPEKGLARVKVICHGKSFILWTIFKQVED